MILTLDKLDSLLKLSFSEVHEVGRYLNKFQILLRRKKWKRMLGWHPRTPHCLMDERINSSLSY